MAVGALDGGMECTDKDSLLTEISRDLDPPSECVVGCTALTYIAMLETQNTQTVRFKDSSAATLPHHKDILTPHSGPTLLSNLCGLHFNVTGHFTLTKRWPTFCVQVVPQQSTLGNGVHIRCPPFLVIMWQMQNHSPTKQGGG
ncbi:unnamed protein product [Coregonus sp. 'balchen']|nr:unnamed protein product [Coregonus sp. 'balchen']